MPGPLPPPGSRYVVRDPQVLRALAHPLRIRLLGLLRTDGPSTATLLGRAVGTSSGVTSYHLRELERYGFVAEVAGRGSRRERWWQALHRVTSWSREELTEAAAAVDGAGAADVEDAAEQLEGQLLDARTRTYAAWQRQRPDLRGPWREVSTLSDLALRVTPEQALELARELAELVLRWSDRAAPPGAPGVGEVAVVADVLALTERPR